MITLGELAGIYKPPPCYRKTAHKSQGKAEAALRALRKQQHRLKQEETLNVYLCPYAPKNDPHWHVGHKKE